MYEIEVIGILKKWKKKTWNVLKAFDQLAKDMEQDSGISGATIFLRKDGKEATINVPARKMMLFRNNDATRLFTHDYLIDQLKTL